MSSEISAVRTRGGIDVAKIKVGDIHYEYEYGMGIKCKVVSEPKRSKEGKWTWQSENLKTGGMINYLLSEGFEHYGPNLYDYEAYQVEEYV